MCVSPILHYRYRPHSFTCALAQIRYAATIVIFKMKQKVCMEGNISIFCNGDGAQQDVKQSHHHKQNTT